MKQSNEKIAMDVSRNSICINVVLSVFKLFAGIFANSSAMISDSVHSMSDVFSTFIVMIGIKISNKAADKEHLYGHERFECVAAIILSVILAATGVGIGYSGILKIVERNYGSFSIPGMLALIAALVSIAVKECMYWYTRHAAKKIDSGVLMADAWHHRSDALSSIGSFVGILGARLGFPIFDPIASVVICLFILKAAFDIFMDAVNKLTDKSCDDETFGRIKKVVSEQKNVAGIDLLQTRIFGDKIYIDVEINMDPSSTLIEAHETAHLVHDAIEGTFPKVKHCMVHVNPKDGCQENK